MVRIQHHTLAGINSLSLAYSENCYQILVKGSLCPVVPAKKKTKFDVGKIMCVECRNTHFHTHMHTHVRTHTHTHIHTNYQSLVSTPHFHSDLVDKMKMAADLLVENLLKSRQSNTKETVQFPSNRSLHYNSHNIFIHNKPPNCSYEVCKWV